MLCCGSGRQSLARKVHALAATPCFTAIAGSADSDLIKQLAAAARLQTVRADHTLADVQHGTFIVVVEGELVHTEMQHDEPSSSSFRRTAATVRRDKVAAGIELGGSRNSLDDRPAEVLATRRAGDFFRLAGAPGGGKASKLVDLCRITATRKSTLLLFSPAELSAALQAFRDAPNGSDGACEGGLAVLSDMVRQDITELISRVPCFAPLDKRLLRTLSQLFS